MKENTKRKSSDGSKAKVSTSSRAAANSMEDKVWQKGKAIAPYYHSNDGSWYTMGATLSPNILNWNTKLTDPSSWDLNDGVLGTPYSYQRKETVTPGIMVLNFVPTIGKCRNFNDAMNVAARGLHTYIWHKATRSTSYDAADLMLYCGLADSLNAFHGLMCRLYGLLSMYGYTNAYYPEAAIYAQGFDPQDLRDHMPEFRTYINMYARKCGRFAVPASLPIFKRHNYLCSNVFKDDDDPDMFQTYIPMPEGFYKFGLDINGWGKMEFLAFKALGNPPYSYAQLTNFGDVLMNSWELNPDMDYMSADILQAMGPENCWSVSTIAEDYRTEPVYDEAFMMQTDNMDFLGATDLVNRPLDVTQTIKGVVQQTTEFANAELYRIINTGSVITGDPLYNKRVIIWNKPTTSLEEVMELTRGVSFPIISSLDTNNNLVYLEPEYAATELWTTMKIVADLDTDPAAPNAFWHNYQGTGWLSFNVSSGSFTTVNPAVYWHSLLNAFKHHPMARLIAYTSNGQFMVGPDNRDLRHWAGINSLQMRQINEQAVFSEWNVAKSNFIQA